MVIYNNRGDFSLKDKTILNFENLVFRGNLLDIGFDKLGIIYSIYKENNDKYQVEYVNEIKEVENQNKEYYDNCTVFFSFSKIKGNKEKKYLINKISDNLKTAGNLFIWDINKRKGHLFFKFITVLLPKGKIARFRATSLELLNDCCTETISKLLEEKFDIQNIVLSDELYYITAKKKGIINGESTFSGNKFKVYT